MRSDKRRYLPYGLQGGQPGTPSWNMLNPGPAEITLPTMGMTPIRRGDLLRHTLAGGGGWGNPFDRDPEAVRLDVWNEKLSAEYVRRVYGVVVDDEGRAVDMAATEAARRGRREEKTQ